MSTAPNYVFLKQAAVLNSYFGELCLDIPRPEHSAAVFSQIETGRIGNVDFYSAPKYDRRTFASRAISWLKYFGAATRFTFRIKGSPLLFVLAQPPFLPLLGYLQRKILGRKYVIWVDDIYPDVLVRQGVVRANGLVVKLWSAFNRLVFANCAHVFTLGPYMLETLKPYLAPGIPTTIVPTWVDTDVISPVPRSENSWAKQHGLEDKFTVLYSGNFVESHEIYTLLEAAKRLRHYSDLHFVLIGSGSKWQSIYDIVSNESHTNVSVFPWQPLERLSESLSSADVSFVSLAAGIEGISMPSKTYFSMSVGTAILASCLEQSDLAEVVRSSNCGIVVKPNAVDEIVSAIVDLRNDKVKLADYQRNSRTAAVERYSRAVNAPLIRRELERITDNVR